MRGEGDGVIARAVGHGGPGARQPGEGAVRQAFQIAVRQGGVGRDDDHDGAVGAVVADMVLEVELIEVFADGKAVHLENAAVIGLHQNPDRPAAQAVRKAAQGGADPALPAEGDRAGAGADRAFIYSAFGSIFYGLHRVFRRQDTRADIIEASVIGLADHGVERADRFMPRLSQRPVENPVESARHGHRVGQHDGRLDLAEFADLTDPGQLAIAVGDGDGGGDAIGVDIAAMRQDGGDAGTDGSVLVDPGDMAHAHPVDIGDGVAFAGRKHARRDPDLAGADLIAAGVLAEGGRAHE
jgi:hypothetical protein